MVGILTLHLHLPGCASLKEKRGRIKPLLARLHRQFNLSVAELGLQDKWQETIISCGMVGNDKIHLGAIFTGSGTLGGKQLVGYAING